MQMIGCTGQFPVICLADNKHIFLLEFTFVKTISSYIKKHKIAWQLIMKILWDCWNLNFWNKNASISFCSILWFAHPNFNMICLFIKSIFIRMSLLLSTRINYIFIFQVKILSKAIVSLQSKQLGGQFQSTNLSCNHPESYILHLPADNWILSQIYKTNL